MLCKRFAALILAAGILPFVKSTLSAGGSKKSNSNDDIHQQLIFVSTVDGKLSALDLKHSGKLLWSIGLNEGPLISSSITKLVYEQDGKTVRLVPSLHGGLFKVDGETVEAVPFDADQLLQSSFRLAESTVLVGGKETCFTGVDVSSGQILYSCNVKGCDKQQDVKDTNDVIVVKRFQQTVRSIENRNGAENWNFSVGEIDIQFLKGSATHLLQTSGKVKPSKSKDQQTFNLHDDVEDLFDVSDLSRIKFVIPDGTICLVKPKNKQFVVWKHTFSSAISSAWILSENRLQKLDMFDSSKVPALGKDDKSVTSTDVIYMGTYDKQVYIQASPSVQQVVTQAVNSKLQNVGHVTYNPPQFTRRPCQSKSKYLTLSGAQKVSKNDKTTALVAKDGKLENDVNKLLFCHDDSHSAKGYYFQGDLSYYSRIQHNNRKGRNTITSDNNDSHHGDNRGYFHSFSALFDRSVLIIITLLTLVLIPILLHHGPSWLRRNSSDLKLPSHYDSADDVKVALPSPNREYESRFLQDFEPQECLGHGGFGVVFKAKNKMDDCFYAVKRILLPHNKSAREKVLREVRALAKLDHPSIVRYFNSWSEQPPSGWQKKQDDIIVKDLSVCSSMQPHTGLDNPTPMSSTSSSQIDHGKFSESCTQGFEMVSESINLTDFPTTGFSQGFSFQPKTADEHTLGETNFSQTNTSWAENSQPMQLKPDDNLKGKFFQSHSTGSESSNNNSLVRNESLPFQHYQDHSMSIVFGHDSEKNYKDRKESEKDSGTSGLIASSSKTSHTTTSGEVNHSDIVKVENEPPHDTVYLYIQMQLCKKQSLKEWLVANRHREKNVYTDIFFQVVGAVKYVHDQGLIHRDLKPSNVLFSLDGTIKVGDFGLVTHTGEMCSELFSFHENEIDKQHTKQAGTTMYMAPEQMTSGHYTEKVDIFALGLILFELVYSFETQMEKVRHFSDARKLKFPKNFHSSFPQEALLVDSMLQIEPETRPSAHDLSGNTMFRTGSSL